MSFKLEHFIDKTTKEKVTPFCMSLERVDRAISAMNVAVEPIKLTTGPVAYTDGHTIWLNSEKLSSDLFYLGITSMEKFVAIFRALNYHELGHVLFTPRIENYFLGYRGNPLVEQMLLALEEGRIETLMVVGKASVAKILEVAYATLVNARDAKGKLIQTVHSYVLLYGREYLTDHDWHLPRHAKADRIIELCKEYNRLALPSQSMRAIAIAEELVVMAVDNNEYMNREQEVEDCRRLNQGVQLPRKKQPDADGAQDVAEKNRADVAVRLSVEPDHDRHGMGAGKASDHVVDALLADADVQAMVAEGMKDLAEAVIGGSAALDRVPISVDSTGEASNLLSNERTRVVRSIRRMVADVEQQRVRRQEDGYIDLQRYAMSEVDLDVFRQLSAGQEDEIPVDVLFLLDCSSSMRGDRINTASQAAWMMHHAALAIPGSKFACVGFNSTFSTLIKRGMTPNNEVVFAKAEGGTQLLGPLDKFASSYLLQSRMANRYLIVASDGSWADTDTVARRVKKLNHAGVNTLHFAITSHPDPHHDSAFQYGVTTNNPADIATVSIKMFTETLRKYAQSII